MLVSLPPWELDPPEKTSHALTVIVNVRDELMVEDRQLWDEAAGRRFGRTYGELTDREKRDIRRELPMTISEAEPLDLLGS